MRIRSLLGRGLLGLLTLIFLLFVGDYVSLKLQIPVRPQTRDVQVRQLMAVPEKNHKTEYILGDPAVQTCSTSLFPQMGLQPCWYVDRHKRRDVTL